MEMLSLSSETNAHIGRFEDYDVKICCTTFPYDYLTELQEGWNLVSIPVVPNSTTIEDVLDGIKENLDIIWAYKYEETAKENKWYYKYYSNGWKGSPEFDEIRPGYGYFILMKEDDVLYGVEKEFDSPAQVPVPSVKLATESWNLIGRYGAQPESMSNLSKAFESLEGNWFSDGFLKFNSLGSWSKATSVDLGKGYWLRTKDFGKDSTPYEPLSYYFY